MLCAFRQQNWKSSWEKCLQLISTEDRKNHKKGFHTLISIKNSDVSSAFLKILRYLLLSGQGTWSFKACLINEEGVWQNTKISWKFLTSVNCTIQCLEIIKTFCYSSFNVKKFSKPIFPEKVAIYLRTHELKQNVFEPNREMENNLQQKLALLKVYW